ncbi:Lrp/AsnC family transcriptional regulator [Schaalia sp. lx-100]|uniref:Lrp/AsnC family transcriptional regulator n=1 Tax=Schaalia sp. lx-100 TaxID=2899081 RepID=UPI001E5B7E5F|nr:Lrp/AsnC family transcriptional regulator [Schaalia sp. lx-100]MCD4558131.1 Lrp/AsnC family transcriptional regulator [Schaalia sp. lx-100]
MVTLTPIEKSLLVELRKDARVTVSSLAYKLGITRATVTNMMNRLEERKVILGYTVLLAHDDSLEEIRAVTLCDIDTRMTQQVIRRLRDFLEIQEICATSGVWDLYLALECHSLSDLDKLLHGISSVNGINKIQTHILLSRMEN